MVADHRIGHSVFAAYETQSVVSIPTTRLSLSRRGLVLSTVSWLRGRPSKSTFWYMLQYES